MRDFCELYAALDSTTKTNAKVAAMEAYFRQAPAADAAWAVFFLRGGKLRAPFSSRLFRSWASEAAGIPAWLFDDCYEAVGDLAETAALLIPDADAARAEAAPLAAWVEARLLPLRSLSEAAQRAMVEESWNQLTAQQRFVWNKLITGAFRVGVSDGLVLRAVSAAAGIPVEVVAHRLMGAWHPSAEAWHQLTSHERRDVAGTEPYPFYLAYPLDATPSSPATDWLIERKWDGIRAQVVRRNGAAYVWSRGGELITDGFAEVSILASRLPDGTVVDGEILAWRDNRVLPFADLQRRIGRKRLSRAILEKVPVTLMAFDLLEWNGEDIRARPIAERRRLLESLPLTISPALPCQTWEDVRRERLSARDYGAEGVMIKRLDSAYGVGREKGYWWKWKVDPHSVDAVLIYAQRGHGRRASLYTDYTFGVWDGDQLVPFAKAYSGLSDEEIREVDRFIRRNTVERFGPVLTVRPELVFEIAFEGIQRSTRHKSGVAVRFPRMARWRTDKKPADADTIDTVKALLGG